jgi:hypothetical protein
LAGPSNLGLAFRILALTTARTVSPVAVWHLMTSMHIS